MLLVIDYGIGNLSSFTKALNHLSLPFTVSANAEDVRSASSLVLIGVGSFGGAMAELNRRGFVAAIREHVAQDRGKLFGVCVGMQMLFEGSEEAPGVPGLGFLPGTVRKLTSQPEATVPHVGFDELHYDQPSAMMRALPKGTAFYFTHSYAVMNKPPGCWTATCRHGATSFVAAVDTGKLAGVQFHPEKSQSNGLVLLRNSLASDGASRA
jgi:glutamine amidotransferase